MKKNFDRKSVENSFWLFSPWLFEIVNMRLAIILVTSTSKGMFLVTDNRVSNGPLGCSLRLFTRTAHSARLLRSATLRYAHFARSFHSRARSFTSLTPSWDSGNSLICAVNGKNAFVVIFRNTPWLSSPGDRDPITFSSKRVLLAREYTVLLHYHLTEPSYYPIATI